MSRNAITRPWGSEYEMRGPGFNLKYKKTHHFSSFFGLLPVVFLVSAQSFLPQSRWHYLPNLGSRSSFTSPV